MDTIVREAWPSVVDSPMFAEKETERLVYRKSYTLEYGMKRSVTRQKPISDMSTTKISCRGHQNVATKGIRPNE